MAGPLWARSAAITGPTISGYPDLEPRFVCKACGKRGAEVRPDFNWNKQPVAVMGYR